MNKAFQLAFTGGVLLLLAACGSKDLPVRTLPQEEHPVTYKSASADATLTTPVQV